VLAAADAAQGAVQLDGRMVDAPVIEQARRLLARAAPR
jgi:citrate lyase beta subunit